MPRLSDTMEEGNIVAWMKNVGDKVAVGDVLAEVETDKATMDLESFQDGTLLYIGVKEGPVEVDGIIAVIGEEGEDFKQLLTEEKKSQSAEQSDQEEKKSEEKISEKVQVEASKESESSKTQPVSSTISDSGTTSDSGRIKASPLARSMAKGEGIDISKIQGTGENGRIVKSDVEEYIKNPPVTPSIGAKPVISGSSVEYGDIPVSQMRKTIARRLGESKFTAPHFYLTIEVNMDETSRLRNMANETGSVKISFNDIVIKACAAALRKHPMINSSWMGDKITIHEEINIGVAVAVEEGLLVPVVKNADQKSLAYINQEVRELAGKAKNKKLSLDEMQGNTFTISNLGMFGIDEFTAIINPPDACILAVGSIITKPIVKNGEIVVGNTMKVTLSCDHRVVDGAKGALFLQTLKSMLENPLMIIS